MWSPTDTRSARWLHLAARGVVVLMLGFALAVLGAVEVWAQAVVALLALAAFGLGYLGGERESVRRTSAVDPTWFLWAIVALGLVQLVPLPVAFVRLVSPGAAAWWQKSQPDCTWCSLSLYPWATRVGLGRLVVFALVFILFARTARVRDVRCTCAVLATIGVLAAGVALIDWWLDAGWWRYYPREAVVPSRLAGPFVNPNHFASCLCLTIGLLLAVSTPLDARHVRLLPKVAPIVGLVLASMALALTGSRLGVIALLVGSMLAFAASYVRRREPPPLGLAVAVLLGLVLGIGPLSARWDALLTGDSRTRELLLRATLAMSGDFVAFGSGLGTFEHLFPAYQPMALHGTWDHAHNDLLEMLTDGGWLAALLAVAFVVTWYRHQLRALAAVSTRHRGLMVGLLAACTAILVHGMGEFPLQIPANAILLAAIMGSAEAVSRRARVSLA